MGEQSNPKVHGSPLPEILENLTRDGYGEPRTIPLDIRSRPLSTEDLRGLTTHSIEFGIVGSGPDNVILAIGDEKSVPGKPDAPEGGFTLHTHPNSGRVNPFLSNRDFMRTIGLGDPKDSVQFLATPNSIITYGYPTRNPSNGEPLDGKLDVYDLVYDWGEKHGVSVLGFSEHPRLSLMEPVERERVLRSLCIDLGMIVAEVPWDDERGVRKVVDVINGASKDGYENPAVEAARRIIDLSSGK